MIKICMEHPSSNWLEIKKRISSSQEISNAGTKTDIKLCCSNGHNVLSSTRNDLGSSSIGAGEEGAQTLRKQHQTEGDTNWRNKIKRRFCKMPFLQKRT